MLEFANLASAPACVPFFSLRLLWSVKFFGVTLRPWAWVGRRCNRRYPRLHVMGAASGSPIVRCSVSLWCASSFGQGLDERRSVIWGMGGVQCCLVGTVFELFVL